MATPEGGLDLEMVMVDSLETLKTKTPSRDQRQSGVSSTNGWFETELVKVMVRWSLVVPEAQ